MARGAFPLKAIRNRIAHLQSELRQHDATAPDQKRATALRALIKQNQTRLAMIEAKLGLHSETLPTSAKARSSKPYKSKTQSAR